MSTGLLLQYLLVGDLPQDYYLVLIINVFVLFLYKLDYSDYLQYICDGDISSCLQEVFPRAACTF